MSKVDVTLTIDELRLACMVGVERRIDSIATAIQNQKIGPKSDWEYDINGACAEYAVAKHLNVYWGGHVRSFKNPDVAHLQIRSTSHKDGHLILRDKDKDEYTYILVITEAPTFSIVGGMSGKKAKSYKPNFKNLEKGYWIPQEDLAPIDSIMEYYRSKK